MNHYPHHIGDFDRATRHLTRIERSVYRDLIDIYYDTEEPLTLDLVRLKRKILAITEQESTAVEQTLNEFFVQTPDGWFHSRCDEEIEHYRSNNSQKAMAGKASAAAKALKKLEMLNGRSTPVATPVQHPFNGASTNQEPRTKNQEPVIKKRKEKTVANAPDFVLPDWVDRLHWDAWHASPKRKKATPAQKQLAVDKLAKWRDAGIDHAQALESSAVAGWQGLFEPRAANSDHRVLPFQSATDKRTQQRTQLIAELTGRNQGAFHAHHPSDPRDTLDVTAYRVA